eukprot:g1367.t1
MSICATASALSQDLGTVVVMTASPQGNDVYLHSSTAGWLHVARTGGREGSPQAISFGSSVRGNATAIALGPASPSSRRVQLAVGTTLAVYFDYNSSAADFERHELVGGVIDAMPVAMAFTAGATADWSGLDLWVGHKLCLNVLRAGALGAWDRVSGAQGLPVANITSLVAGPEPGTLWLGSREGLALMQSYPDPAQGEDGWRYFGGDRWFPSNDTSGFEVMSVAAVAAPLAPASPSAPLALPAVWVATPRGVALVYSRAQTLEQKAAEFTARVPLHSRHGWVAAVSLRNYGDQSAGSVLKHDGDNDGLWTGMFIASQIFRYAVTGEQEARSLAWKHFSALEFLHNVTETHGFIARSAVRCGEPHQSGDSGICPQGSPNSCGWVNSSACYAGIDDAAVVARGSRCCWIWKRDTSSDEVTGHFFTLLLAHELLAQSAPERARVAALLCASAAYIVDGGYIFVDPVSQRGTSWGYWSPELLNGVPGKPNERGQNSLELLGFLAAAAKVCDASHDSTLSQPPGRFGAAFAELVRAHGYDRNTLNALNTAPAALAFFDFRLAFLSYHSLMLAAPALMVEGWNTTDAGSTAPIPLTPSEASLFKQRLQHSLQRYWDEPGATVTAYNNKIGAFAPLYWRIVAGGRAPVPPTAARVFDEGYQLRRYPTELIDWPTRNSHRLDVRLQPDWLRCAATDCTSNVVVEHVLPADEAFTRASSDFVTEAAANSVDGGSGSVLNAPNAWLLVYWMQRFYLLPG